MDINKAAQQYLNAGFSIIPCLDNKRPTEDWHQYTTTRIDKWNGRSPQAIAVVGGEVSCGLEIIDVDNGSLINDFLDRIGKEIASKLIIAKTQSSGYHIFYKRNSAPGNTKLATAWQEVETSGTHAFSWRPGKKYKAKKINKKYYISTAAIETRGTGGYVLIEPSKGYNFKDNKKLSDAVFLADNEVEKIWNVAESFGDVKPADTKIQKQIEKNQQVKSKPFDDLNHRTTPDRLLDLLIKHGWEYAETKGNNIRVRRPGKAKGISGTIGGNKEFPLFYCFTSSTEFEPDKAYMPYQVYALLEHDNDFTKAAGILYGLGYGKEKESYDIDFQNTAEIMSTHFKPIKWAVRDIIPEGLTILAAKPKFGKSWLMLSLGYSVATGSQVWSYKDVESTGSVYYLALEDSFRRIQDRIKNMEGFFDKFPENFKIAVVSPTIGNGFIDAIKNILEKDKKAGLVIIDTLQKIRPSSTGKRQIYQAEYEDYGRLQALAINSGVPFIAIHHTRKANGMAVDNPVDEMSGSTGLQGVADTLIVCSHDKEQDCQKMFVTGREVEENTYKMEFDLYDMTWNLSDYSIDNINPDFAIISSLNDWFEQKKQITQREASKIWKINKRNTNRKLKQFVEEVKIELVKKAAGSQPAVYEKK